MSIFFDPRKRRPRVWTYFVFTGLTMAILGGFLVYGQKKADERAKEIKRQEAEPRF